MQAAVARAGIERDVGNVERAQRLGDDVAAEAGGIDAGRRRAVEAGDFGVGCARRGGRGRTSATVLSPQARPAGGGASNRITRPDAIGRELQPGIAVGRLHADLLLEGEDGLHGVAAGAAVDAVGLEAELR